MENQNKIPVTPQVAPPVAVQPPVQKVFKLDVENGSGNEKPSMLQTLMKASGSVFMEKMNVPVQPVSDITKSVLGPRPTLGANSTFIRQIEERRNRKSLRILIGTLLVAVLVFGYFKLALSPDVTIFGPNIATRFEESNQEIKQIQTQVNEQYFRTARLHLDRLSQLGDGFRFHTALASSATLSAVERAESDGELNRLRGEMKNSLVALKSVFIRPLAVPMYSNSPRTPAKAEGEFADALRAHLLQRKNELGDLRDEAVIVEQRYLDSMIKAVDNAPLRRTIADLDLDVLTGEKITEVLSLLQQGGGDDLSIISRIKEGRIRWTEIIASIESVTRQVDALYGQGLFDEIGGIRYTDYDFDRTTGQVTVSGLTKTEDSKTFSLIANLIDRFEKSSGFKDIEMRSFSKSAAEGAGFSSSLRLTFYLQSGDDVRDERIP
ncbi:MAG: hypothetical protein AAB592_03145 [Patescibacteria group bacterium]